ACDGWVGSCVRLSKEGPNFTYDWPDLVEFMQKWRPPFLFYPLRCERIEPSRKKTPGTSNQLVKFMRLPEEGSRRLP
ncbi:hypothetical protein NG726_36545, partial [Pseudomonas sp. MOB-449]|nr:hypothetical protein [Pseudomonas sp. MOB-449]